MSKFKVLVPKGDESVPRDIERMLRDGQAEKIVAEEGNIFLKEGRAKLVTIHNSRLFVADI